MECHGSIVAAATSCLMYFSTQVPVLMQSNVVSLLDQCGLGYRSIGIAGLIVDCFAAMRLHYCRMAYMFNHFINVIIFLKTVLNYVFSLCFQSYVSL